MPGKAGTPCLTVYSRVYCHLCDDMIAGLRALQARHRFDMEIVDVDSDPQLERRYGELVPLLMHGEIELCRYHLDTPGVTAYLTQIG